MTDSNLQIEPINGDDDSTKEVINETPQFIDPATTEAITNANKEGTVLQPVGNPFAQTTGFLNWDANLNTENLFNEFYIQDNELDIFRDESFDAIRRGLYSDDIKLGETETKEDTGVIEVSDEMLKYLGFVNLFDKYANDRTPIRVWSDRIEIEKLFKEQTGFTFDEFLNNDISIKDIETPEFQTALDNMYEYYREKGFTVEIPERTNLTQFEQTMKGLGIEIGGGITLDVITAPLIKAGPYGILAYGFINAIGGAYLNYVAQEKRLGQTGFLGRKGELSYGELVTSTLLQTFPSGVEAKGLEGILKSFRLGAAIGAGEVTVRTLIDEQRWPELEEYLISIGLGGTFAAAFKGSLEFLGGLTSKYGNKTSDEINKVITKTETDKIDEFIDQTLVLQKQLTQEPNQPPSNKQNLGDPEFTPNQYTNKVGKSENFGLIEELIRLKKLKGDDGISPVKTQYSMKLAGLNLFDDGIIALSKTQRIREYTQIYAELNNIVPSEDLAVALTQTVALATDNVVNANVRLTNAINLKDFDLIRKAIDDLDNAFDEVNDWLSLSLPQRTTFGRTGKALQIEADSGIAGKSVDEVMGMSQAERRIAAEEVGDVSFSLDKQQDATTKLKKELTNALLEAEETGDFTRLLKVVNTIRQTNGDVQKIVALEKHQILPGIINKAAKIINEIGINALMSAPGTNEVNLLSGIVNSYLNAFQFALGARSRTEIEAALRHVIALHTNFNFARKAWKRSWDIEDNFLNMGTSKFESGLDRFQIATTRTDLASRIGINWTGKGIRVPSRLMTSNDALIQAPNLIGYATMKFFLHGKNNLGYTGEKLNKYIDESINTILEYLLSNGKGELKDTMIETILKESKEFSKSITFTNDIRTESVFGAGAEKLNRFAQNPLARIYFTFVRTPANLMSAGFKLTPGIGTPIGVGRQNKALKLGSEVVNYATLNKFLADEVRHDLLSPDPLIAQRARGGMNLAQGFGLTVAGLSLYYGNKFLEEDYVPPLILTGGGPNFWTPEGNAMWKAMYANEWRPYSFGQLQYNEDGSPKFVNGEPVYLYTSYENIGIDPLSQVIGMLVDFTNSSGLIDGKPYDDFTVGWAGVVGRNIFGGKSYTAQINEFMQIITSAAGEIQDTGEFGDTTAQKDYKRDQLLEYVGKQISARLIPYSNLLARFQRIPGDILQMMGLKEEEIEQFLQKRDTEVRPGDIIDQDLEIADENFNDKQLIKELWAYLRNQIQEKIPGYSANLPFLREHVTNEPILYPHRAGLDLISLTRQSETNTNVESHKYFQALKLIGRQLPEPKDIITGGFTRQEFEPVKLDTTQYAQLKEFINTHIPEGGKYGDRTLLEAINAFLDTEEYQVLSQRIKDEGLNSEFGREAAKIIYSHLYRINNYYIKSGEGEFLIQVLGMTEIEERLRKKGIIKQEFNQLIREELLK